MLSVRNMLIDTQQIQLQHDEKQSLDIAAILSANEDRKVFPPIQLPSIPRTQEVSTIYYPTARLLHPLPQAYYSQENFYSNSQPHHSARTPTVEQQHNMYHPHDIMGKSHCKSSRQHQIESKRIEHELQQELQHRRSISSTSSSSSSKSSISASSANLSHKQRHPVKAKKRRASTKQLDILNQVFDRTFFPSTQLREELGKQLGMSPRTVQIWFQNKRQAIRSK